ncbi:MAG: class I SAM-dependent methyltransferase [Patescibacteria group bacterium]|nr:class I SAM-dependent methyltransferase [Patescibacteria group bacterium]
MQGVVFILCYNYHMFFSDPEKNVTQFKIGHGMQVADLGAGSGFYTIESARKVGGAGKVYAIEVQKDLLEKLKTNAVHEHLFNVEVILGDVENIGGTRLRDGSIDKAIASNILFQVEHKDNFCLEIKRILKPGGKVLIVDWSDKSPLGPKTLVPEAITKSLFEKAGFDFDSSISAGEHHYGLIFNKHNV